MISHLLIILKYYTQKKKFFKINSLLLIIMDIEESKITIFKQKIQHLS